MSANLDPDNLRRAAIHVAHDIRMLDVAYARRADAFAYTAWFIHGRSVMDFLDGRGSNPDDIRARDFFDPPETWDEADRKVVKPADYEEYRQAVHKLAAHLTYTRIAYAETGQFAPSAALTEHLIGRSAMFARLLPPERLAWFGGFWVQGAV
jgi:hypothetical protein